MREFPQNKLNPKIKNVWRINDAIWIVLLYVISVPAFAIVSVVEPGEVWAGFVALGLTAIAILALVVCVVVLPPIRYARWRYEVTDDFLDIARGIVWRKRFVIPFIRVQNTDTKQGPVLRLFGLSSVTVATAAGNHEIPGLDAQEAELLRDRAAELARIAREDV